MRRLLLALAGLCAPALLHAADFVGPAVSATLEPGKVHEACMKLKAGEKRRYTWKANVPVDFNIHYHRGSEVFYPVQRKSKRGDGGTFTAKTADDYCWMWTARDAPAKIEGQIR